MAFGDNRLPLKSRSELELKLNCSSPASAVATFPQKANAYVLSLIQSAHDPIGRQVLPDPRELDDQTAGNDPLAEESQSPAPQIIHRYPNRVVFLVSDQCAVHCRFCMRKRRVTVGGEVGAHLIEQGLHYIRSQSQINEVVLSGGDPLMLDDGRLTGVLQALRSIPHVRLLRIHTRIPSMLPQRVTQALAQRLAAFRPIYVNIHFNHPAELTTQARHACGLLADAGIPLGSQTVLLKGINDEPGTLIELFETLLELRVRPYYLHQLDRVPGTAHFRVALDNALALLAKLRGQLSGLAIPHFMVDLPGGGGKVALTPQAILKKEENHWLIRNWEGHIFQYPFG